jgi:hypothetical protein
MRRINALLRDLIQHVPDERRPVIRYWQERVKIAIARSFVGDEERTEAMEEDRQGLGVPASAFRLYKDKGALQ